MTRRTGDHVEIPGDYQYRALTEGPVVQRFWHAAKMVAISLLLPPKPTDSVVDIGCGSGVISDFLGSSGARVVGVDGNERAISFARQTFERENVRFILGLVDDTLRLPSPVNNAYCLEVIEHIHHDQTLAMLKHLQSVLAVDGRLFITTPNYRSLWPLIEWAMDRLAVAPTMDREQHVEHYTKGRLSSLLAQAGYEVDHMATFLFAAPWLSPLSWSLAKRCLAWEMRSGVLPGSLIACVCHPRRR